MCICVKFLEEYNGLISNLKYNLKKNKNDKHQKNKYYILTKD